MEDSGSTIPQEIITSLKNLFFQKGYPANTISLLQKFNFYHNDLFFSFFLPITITYEEKTLLILDYHPSKRGLSHLERPLIAIARLFFNPPPYYAILTNVENFYCIEVYPQIIKKGGAEVVPDFPDLLAYKPLDSKVFKKEIEEKILAFYLSGG
ncbi:MAG: hypothetical protein ACK4Y7_01510 [Caldimicrobium sp.]